MTDTNEFREALDLINIWNTKAPDEKDYKLYQWAVNYMRDHAEVIQTALTYAANAYESKELTALVEAGEMAAQGECSIYDGVSSNLSIRISGAERCDRQLCSVTKSSGFRENAEFIFQAANTRAFQKKQHDILHGGGV